MAKEQEEAGQTTGADALIGADRELALLHVPASRRAAFQALWGLDAAMGDVVARASDPGLARIKLAWWRERLEELDTAGAPAEPRLQAAAERLLPLGITGAALAGLEPGWTTLLDEPVNARLVAERGELLFRIGSRLLDSSDPQTGRAGALHALASVARRGVPELFDAAEKVALELSGHRFPRRLRCITGLARLSARDLKQQDPLEPEGSPARAAALLRHRWSGIVVRRS